MLLKRTPPAHEFFRTRYHFFLLRYSCFILYYTRYLPGLSTFFIPKNVCLFIFSADDFQDYVTRHFFFFFFRNRIAFPREHIGPRLASRSDVSPYQRHGHGGDRGNRTADEHGGPPGEHVSEHELQQVSQDDAHAGVRGQNAAEAGLADLADVRQGGRLQESDPDAHDQRRGVQGLHGFGRVQQVPGGQVRRVHQQHALLPAQRALQAAGQHAAQGLEKQHHTAWK